jgi:hypothetical protein
VIRVAQWHARGMHAGQIVRLRASTGNHRWRVVARFARPAADGLIEKIEQIFNASEPCPIRAMYDTVMREIGNEIEEGALVHDASLEFFILPRKAP